NVLVATVTGFCRRHAGGRRVLHFTVAVAAVESQLSDVKFVAEGNRLVDGHIDSRHTGGIGPLRQDPTRDAHVHGRSEQSKPQASVPGTGEVLRHGATRFDEKVIVETAGGVADPLAGGSKSR